MRTFQELHARALADAVNANARGQYSEAEKHRELAAEWDAIDREAVRRAAARGHGPGAHRG